MCSMSVPYPLSCYICKTNMFDILMACSKIYIYIYFGHIMSYEV